MTFLKEFERVVEALKATLRQGVETKAFTFKAIAKAAEDASPNRISRFCNPEKNESINVHELVLFINATVEVVRQIPIDERRQNVPAFDQLQKLLDGDEAIKVISGMFHAQKLVGNTAHLKRLAGCYFVVRRTMHVDPAQQIICTSLLIRYDEERNICTWTNAHQELAQTSNQPRIKMIEGLVVETKSMLNLFGFREKTAVLHAMSLMIPESTWGEFPGVVMTVDNGCPIASRSVMFEARMDFKDTQLFCRPMSIEEAVGLGLQNPALLSNHCEPEEVLRPEEV